MAAFPYVTLVAFISYCMGGNEINITSMPGTDLLGRGGITCGGFLKAFFMTTALTPWIAGAIWTFPRPCYWLPAGLTLGLDCSPLILPLLWFPRPALAMSQLCPTIRSCLPFECQVSVVWHMGWCVCHLSFRSDLNFCVRSIINPLLAFCTRWASFSPH